MAGLIDYSIIKPELANALATGFQKAQDRKQTQAQQQRQNALADLQFRAAQRGEEEALMEREAYKNQDPLAALRAAGLGKQALAYEKQQQDQRTAQINQAKDALTLMKESTSKIIGNPNPEFAKRVLTQFGQVTGQDITADIADLEKLGNNPTAIQQWAAAHSLKADQLLPQFEKIDTGAGTQITAFNRVTGQPIAPQISTNEPVGAFQGRPQDVMNQLAAIADPTERTAATQAYQRQLAGQQMPQPATQGTFIPKGVSQAQQATEAREQQRIALEQRRVDLAEKEAKRKESGVTELKPLTEQQTIKLRTDVAKDYKSATTALSQMDDLLNSIQQVKTAPGLSAATGYTGKYLPSRSEGAAAQAETRLANLRGKVTALGKATAAMSGSIGSIANQEWKILADQIAVLDEVKGKGPLLEQIDLVESQAKGAIERIRDAYEKTRAEDFERFPQFRDLPKSKAPGAPAAASPDIDALLNKYK